MKYGFKTNHWHLRAISKFDKDVISGSEGEGKFFQDLVEKGKMMLEHNLSSFVFKAN